jgi:two-component sensor histidine kinase
MEMNNYLAVFASLFIVFLLTWLFTKNTRKYIEVLEVNNREKEVLLREIHHRVKNNLQIVSSLLNLQSDGLTDDHSKRILENSVGRIKSMALVHEKLYRSDNLSKIMLKDYFAGLLNYIGQSYQNQIEFKLDIDESELDIEQSLSLGLIVNELVTNSMKHAFNELPPDNERPNIIVRFRNIKGAMELCVHDNGRGMPDGSIINTSATLGLQLVKTLVDELEGTISVNSSSGTEIKIKFNHVGG